MFLSRSARKQISVFPQMIILILHLTVKLVVLLEEISRFNTCILLDKIPKQGLVKSKFNT